MVTTAAIIGGSALASAGISSGTAKKGGDGGGGGDQGQKILAEIAARLFGETEPVRQMSLQQAETALREGRADTPLLQQTQSAIRAGGERQIGQFRQSAERMGIGGSSVAMAGEEDINRAIAELLSQANVAELASLTEYGRNIGFGAVPGQAAGAAGTLAGVQGAMARQQQAQQFGLQTGVGQALGQATALLLQRSLTPSTASGAGATYPGLGTQYGAGLEAIF